MDNPSSGWIYNLKAEDLDSATVQFSDPEKAFSLRQFDFDINSVSSENQNSNNNRERNSDGQIDDQNSYRYYHSSFMLLTDGHVDNKIILKDSGFVVEENLGTNPSILNRTRVPSSWSPSNLQINILNRKISSSRPNVRLFVYNRESDYRNRENLQSSKFDSTHRRHHQHQQHHRHQQHDQHPCVMIHATFKGQSIFGECRPSKENFDSCFVDLILPQYWWPRRPLVWEKYDENTAVENVEFDANIMKFKMINHQSPKRPKTIVKLFYAIPHQQNSIPSPDDDSHSCSSNEPFVQAPRPSKTTEKNLKFVADVQLIDENPSQYVALPLDKTLNILVPNRHFYPGDIFAAIILYHYVPDFSMDESAAPYLFQIKCEARNGVRLLGTEPISDSEWSTSTEMLYKQAALTITAFYRGQLNLNESFSGEIISILLQIAVNDETGAAYPNDVHPSEIVVNETNKKNIESDKKPCLIASISYVNDLASKDSKDSSPPSSNVNFGIQNANDSRKNVYYSPSNNLSPKSFNIRASFNVEKDSIKSLMPFDFVNTAVLTRNQVSTNLKVFSLSHAGVVSDVTLQTVCTARELSVIKVTPTCTSVYADGSESRGDMNALINITYLNFRTIATYNVWYPEFPVDILISDPVLHAIKNWRIHDEKYFAWTHPRQKRNGTIFYGKDAIDVENKQIYPKSKSKMQRMNCRLRFQESMVRVFARFRVDDLSTGRRSYLGGRKTQFDVTFLSRDQMKILDPRLAYLKTIDGTLFVHGLYPGRTEVQLISSYSRIPLGAAHVEITNEKVSVRSLKAESIADISVTILADQVSVDVYHIIVQKSTIFTRQYQPGRIKLDVEYSSGFSLPLSLINPEDYLLDVASRDNSLVLLNFDKKQYNDGNRISRNNGGIDHEKDSGGGVDHDLKNSISPASRNAIIPTNAPPTFLVIGETKGNVLYVSLFSSSVCYKNSDAALYSTTVYVEATFEKLKAKSSENSASSPFLTKNPPNGYPAIEPQRIDSSDSYHYAGGDFFNSRRSADVSVRNPSTHNRRFPSKTSDNEAKLTHMEVAIYILVGVFVLVAAAFALHCYAVADKSAVNRRRLSRTLNSRRNIVIAPSAFRYASYLTFPDWLRWPLNGLVRFVRENAGVVSSARQEFVWVGPDELNDSLASSCSQRLLNREQTVAMINNASSALSNYDEDYDARNDEEVLPGRTNGVVHCKPAYNMDDEGTDWIDDDDDDNNDSTVFPASLIDCKNPPPSTQNDARLAPLFADDDEWPLSPVTLVESNNLTFGKNKGATAVLENGNIDMDTSFEQTSTLIGSPDYKSISIHTTVRAVSSGSLTKNDASSSNNNLELLSRACNDNSVIIPYFEQSCDKSHNTISYLGSEVSIIMSRKPLLEVHDSKSKTSSWNEKRISKCKLDSINSFTEPKQTPQQRCSSSSSRRRPPQHDPTASLLLGKTWLKSYQKKNDNFSSMKNSNKKLMQQNYQRPSIRNYLKQYGGGNSQSMTGRRTSFKMRITSNPIGDSSSEQNLSSYCSNMNGLLTGDDRLSCRDDQMIDSSRGINRQLGGISSLSSSSNNYFFGGFGLTAKSESDLNWDSASLGMNESQLRDYFNSLRESMA